MKIISSNFQMEELFKAARQQGPVMDIKEVEGIINAGSYTPGERGKTPPKSIGRLIVLTALFVFPLVGYLALKSGKESVYAKENTAVNTSEQAIQIPQYNLVNEAA